MVKKNNEAPILVLGAGVAGLAAANKLRELGKDFHLIEQNVIQGGLTRSVYADRYVFDYTGHFLHLAKLKHPDDLGITKKGEWIQISKKAYCYVDGVFTKAPFQYHLEQLPEKLKNYCLSTYREICRNAPEEPESRENESLESYFFRTFGEGITNTFLKPYNEKILAIKVADLSASSINRFFPKPVTKLIEEGALEKETESQDYNASFWYPANNGIQQLVDNMLGDKDFTNEEITGIDLEGKTVFTNSHKEYPYSMVFSSLPLDKTLKYAAESYPDGSRELEKLSCASVLAFQIGVRAKIPEVLSDKHWIYVPDQTILFHRVGFYSNFNSVMAPEGCYNMYVEVGCSEHRKLDLANIQQKVIDQLAELGWLKAENIEVILNHKIETGYVHFNRHWDSTVPGVLNSLSKLDFHSIGRYGSWNYISMEDSVLNSWSSVENASG